MIADYNKHRKISNGLRRIKKKKIPIYEGRAGALPPIHHATEGEETYDSANSERRSPNPNRTRDPSLEEVNRQPGPVSRVLGLRSGRLSL